MRGTVPFEWTKGIHSDMEDGTIRTLCAAVAAQILVPIDTSAASLPCSSVGSTTPSSSAEAPSVSSSPTLQELKRSADAVTQHAITLYRLCRHARPPVQISPHDSGAAQDASYCVGASLRLLQPAVWEALSRRALLLRPRTPSLRLGRPVPVEVSLKELERFDARTQHLTKRGGVATAPITEATASKDGQQPSSASQWNGTASVVIDAVLAERLAALYFYPLLTPLQRTRYPQMMQDLRPEALGTAKTLPPPGGRNGKRGRPSGRPSDRREAGPSEGMCLYGAYHCDDGDMVVHRADPAGHTTAEGFYPLDDDNTSDSSDGAQSSDGDAAWHALRAVTLGLTHDERTEGSPAGPSVGGYLPHPASPASLLRSARQLPLVEISAQVEATRHFLFWWGLEALVVCPLLYQPSHSGTYHSRISAQSSSWSLPSSHSHHTTTWDALHQQLSHVCGSTCQMVSGVSKHPHSTLSGATSFVPWSGPHMLCPTRVQAHRLLPGPPSLVTGPSLWHRLLLCAGWLVIYADVILPHAIECLTAQLREGVKETAAYADGMPSPAGERMGGPSNVFTPLNILSPIEMDTIVYAVTVVREARHYDAVSCPVCDGLQTERATLRWASLSSGPRAALRRAMQPFLQQYCDQGGVTSATQTTTTSAGAAAASSSLASRGTTIELATWLDSPYEARLRACWGAFASSPSMTSATAVLQFAGETTSPSPCRRDGVKSSDDGDPAEDHHPPPDARGVFVQVVARRLHAVAELLNFTARRSGNRSTNRHGVGTRCPLQPPPTEEESNVLRRHGWVLLADDDPVNGSHSHRNTQQTPPPPLAVALRELPTRNLLDMVTKALMGDCPTERWAAFLLSPLTVASLRRRGDAAVAVASPSPWGRVNCFSESSTSSPKGTKEPHPRPATATSRTPCDATPRAQHQPSLTPRRATRAHVQTSIRQLQLQRTQVHELLDFSPRIPPLRDEDAVLECSRCYSFFHQDCVGPEQRDVAQRCFLCHTCRLRCASALSPICQELVEETE